MSHNDLANNFNVFEFRQGNQHFLSGILPFRVLKNRYNILVYGNDEYGYQRQPSPRHVKAIKSYLLQNKANNSLPTTIILSADQAKIQKLLLRDTNKRLSLNLGNEELYLFRVVDGQHRLLGLEDASKEDETFLEYPLNVVILVTPPQKRSVELEIFTTINSKAKRIRTDLALLAEHNYEVLEKNIRDVNKHIGVKASFKIKENYLESVWYKAIKFDIHADTVIGAVSVVAFVESIDSIVKSYLKSKPTTPDISPHKLIKFADEAANEVADFIIEAWKTVHRKWRYCFKEDLIIDDDENPVQKFYHENYYIQRTLGVKTLNVILGEIVKETGLSSNAQKEFKTIINDSRIKEEDWKIGGKFSGLSSESGFQKARDWIRNKS